jgi:hypothetical protein
MPPSVMPEHPLAYRTQTRHKVAPVTGGGGEYGGGGGWAEEDDTALPQLPQNLLPAESSEPHCSQNMSPLLDSEF